MLLFQKILRGIVFVQMERKHPLLIVVIFRLHAMMLAIHRHRRHAPNHIQNVHHMLEHRRIQHHLYV